MEYKVGPIEIPSADPFKNDALNRKESAEILTQFIETINKPFVLAIDSSWGTGKTTFVKMLRQYMINDGFSTLYFSAWENDFCGDPLISLVGELSQQCSSDGEANGKQKAILDYVKKYGSAIVRSAFKAGIGKASGGLLEVDKIAEEVETSDGEIKNLVEKYEEEKRNVSEFKAYLAEYVNTLQQGGKDSKPLVIFVDELDRCRPNYALELLEYAKHLFDINGIVFILSLDKEQLGYSIQTLYGSQTDIDGYLRRFIDLVYEIPRAEYGDFISSALKRFGIEKEFINGAFANYNISSIKEVFEGFAASYNVSLRKLEQCFCRFGIAMRSMVTATIKDLRLIAYLILFMELFPESFKRLVERDMSIEALSNIMQEMCEKLTENMSLEYLAWFEACTSVYLHKSENLDSLLEHYTKRHSEKQMLREYYRFVLSNVNLAKIDRSNIVTKSALRQITIAERFVR